MKAALLYASWIDFGEQWNTPKGFHDSMLDRGWEIQHYNLYHNNGEIRKYTNQSLNQLHEDIRKGYKPDIIMNFDYGVFDAPHLDRQTYRDAIWILECGDEIQAFERNFKKAHKFDILLSPDYRCVEWYKQAGMNCHFWTHAADTKIYFPRKDISIKFDIVTTCGERGRGQITGITKELEKSFGSRYLNDRFYYGNSHAEFISNGKITFQCSQFSEITRRIFEAAACGRFVLTDRLSSSTRIEELMEDGVHCVYYDSIADCIEKANYYLEHENELWKIANQGMQYVIENHSVIARINKLEKIIEQFKAK